VPRYQRRTRELDEAILGAYPAGANTRRIRKALAPLRGEEHPSKSAVSRIAARLKAQFTQWRERDLSDERPAILFLDSMHLKVRMAPVGLPRLCGSPHSRGNLNPPPITPHPLRVVRPRDGGIMPTTPTSIDE